MTVTRIESVTKTKFKVYVDDQFAFVLYKGELSRYQIQEGTELSQNMLDTIETEVVLKRAKARAMMIERHKRARALRLVPHTDGMTNQRA